MSDEPPPPDVNKSALISGICTALDAAPLFEEKLLVNFATLERILGHLTPADLGAIFLEVVPMEAPRHDDPSFPEWLSAQIADLGLKKAAFAREVPMQRSDLSNIEAGNISVGRKRWTRIVGTIQRLRTAKPNG